MIQPPVFQLPGVKIPFPDSKTESMPKNPFIFCAGTLSHLGRRPRSDISGLGLPSSWLPIPLLDCAHGTCLVGSRWTANRFPEFENFNHMRPHDPPRPPQALRTQSHQGVRAEVNFSLRTPRRSPRESAENPSTVELFPFRNSLERNFST